MNVGVIGYGSFGEFISRILVGYTNVFVYSKRDVSANLPNRVLQKEFTEVAACPIVVIASGLSEMDEVCSQLAINVKPQTVVFDVCSVKLKPLKIMDQHLSGKCQFVGTHPLFGPQTTENFKIAGKKIVVCPSEGQDTSKFKDFLSRILRLEVIEMSAEEHDKEMAWIHGLTFFVGRGLLEINPPASKLTTGYYQKLLDLVELEQGHSIELFRTVESGNPYAAEVRQKLLTALRDINEGL